MPWSPDLRTVLVYGAILSLLVAAVLWLAWRFLPSDFRPALRWWLAGLAMQPLGFLLIGLRHQIPDVLSIVLASTLVASGIACTAIALRRFCEVPERRLRLLVAIALVIVSLVWFTYIQPSLHWRQIVVSALLAVLLGSGARAVLRRNGSTGMIVRLTGVLFALGTAVQLFRSGHELFAPSGATDLLNYGPGQVICFAILGMLPALSTIGFLLMCTERSQRALESAARLDYLTGIYNRRAIEDLAQQAIAASRRHGTPLAVLIIDIDHFKRINDELGHHAGDQALIEAVRRIRVCLRTEDLIGRLGGEEFVAALPNTDGPRGQITAERVRVAFDSQPIQSGDTAIVVTVSIGVSVLALGEANFSQLLRRADLAMYAAKNNGRNQVVMDPESLRSVVG